MKIVPQTRKHGLSLAGASLFMAALMGSAGPARAAIPEAERNVLLVLYTNTNGAGWTDHAGWGGAAGSECTWYGVECSGDHVTGLFLDSNHLAGSLPSLTGLTALEAISAFGNALSGGIPELAGMANLRYFEVSVNQLSGPLPSLSDLQNLGIFGAQLNQLSGLIAPFADLPALRGFVALGNRLSGSLPSLDALGSLESFYVDYIELTGFVPSLDALQRLKRIQLNDNQLRGDMPSPPNPGILLDGDSQLCGNYLTPIPNADWDRATGESPWYQHCTPLPDRIFADGFDP